MYMYTRFFSGRGMKGHLYTPIASDDGPRKGKGHQRGEQEEHLEASEPGRIEASFVLIPVGSGACFLLCFRERFEVRARGEDGSCEIHGEGHQLRHGLQPPQPLRQGEGRRRRGGRPRHQR